MFLPARLLGLSHRCHLFHYHSILPPSLNLLDRRCCPSRSMACTRARSVSIQLTQQEQELCSILLKTLEHEKLDTTMRCAGGWVRDKLLGKDSHDIDIALDNQLGGDFAEHVNTYLTSQDLETHKVGCFPLRLSSEPGAQGKTFVSCPALHESGVLTHSALGKCQWSGLQSLPQALYHARALQLPETCAVSI